MMIDFIASPVKNCNDARNNQIIILLILISIIYPGLANTCIAGQTTYITTNYSLGIPSC